MNDIKRKAELLIVLFTAAEDLRVVPAKGGSDTSDAEPMVPPFAVPACTGGENLIRGEDTWRLTMTLTYVTHIDDTPSPRHSADIARLVDRVRAIGPGEDTESGIRVHGARITGDEQIENSERQSHGDVLTFELVCTGLDASI